MKSSPLQMHTPLATLRDMAARMDPGALGELVGRSSDVVLAVDADDVVRDVSARGAGHERADPAEWVGRRLEDVVTVECRGKAQQLLERARSEGSAGPRHMNHPITTDEDLPVSYSAHRMGDEGAVILFGRDLSEIAGLQRQLVAAQQSMEREYERLRGVEARYRQLFHTMPEAVAIVAPKTGRIQEANPAAGRLFGREPDRIAGARLARLVHRSDATELEAALLAAAAGRAQTIAVRPAGSAEAAALRISLFRAADETLLLVRAVERARGAAGADAAAAQLMREAPDGVVITDAHFRINWANDAFLGMVGAALAEQVQGAALEDHLGRSGVDADLLVEKLRRQGRVRYFSTVLRGALGDSAPVEISAASLPEGEGFGFVIRSAALRPAESGSGVGKTGEQLANLVGTAPLKELVRQSTDLIEKLCIETALEMTGDNRASAAELLGLSRQSLYSKMRRFGIGDLPN